MHRNISVLFSIFFCFMLVCIPALAQNEESGNPDEKEVKYIEFQKRFDDRTGTLSEDDLRAIEEAASKEETEIGLKAFVLIMNDIEEWDFDEFAKKQFLYWKSKGVVDDMSYLFLIQLDNRKFQIVRGDYLSDRENDYEILKLRNILKMEFDDGDYAGGIIGFIKGLNDMPSLHKAIAEEKTKKEKSEKSVWFIVMGIIIIIFVLMRMNYMNQMKARREHEKNRRGDSFIE